MPVALWCVLVAGVLPVLTVGVAKWGVADMNNNHPRDWATGLTGYRRRAYAAHQNGFEAFPFFAAAVLAALAVQAPLSTLNVLAVSFIAARLAYTACYLLDTATLRSVCWATGWFITIAIMTLPVWAR